MSEKLLVPLVWEDEESVDRSQCFNDFSFALIDNENYIGYRISIRGEEDIYNAYLEADRTDISDCLYQGNDIVKARKCCQEHYDLMSGRIILIFDENGHVIEKKENDKIPSVWDLFPYIGWITKDDKNNKPDEITLWDGFPDYDKEDGFCDIVNMGEFINYGPIVKNIWDIKFEGTGQDAIIRRPTPTERPKR